MYIDYIYTRSPFGRPGVPDSRSLSYLYNTSMYMYQLSVASGVTGLCVVVAGGGTCFGQAVARLFSSSFFSFFSATLCAGRVREVRGFTSSCSCNAHLNSSTLRVLRGRAACFGQVFSSAHNFPGRDRPARRTAATSFNVSFTHTYISSLNAFFLHFTCAFPLHFRNSSLEANTLRRHPLGRLSPRLLGKLLCAADTTHSPTS